MKLSWTARFRVETVRMVAKLFCVPILIHEHEIREVIIQNIHDYLQECDQIAEKVFEVTIDERLKFKTWACGLFFKYVDDPLLVHDHPMYFVGSYFGYERYDDPRWAEIEKKMNESSIRLRWPNGPDIGVV